MSYVLLPLPNLSTHKYHIKLNLLLTEMGYREAIPNGWINYLGTERIGRKYHVQEHLTEVLSSSKPAIVGCI